MSTQQPGVFAATAPERDDEDDDRNDLAGLTDAQRDRQADMDELCTAYADWCRTRGFFGPPPVLPSVLGKLTKKTRRRSSGPPDAACSAMMSALHLAVLAQPREALDRRVFELNYLYRVRSVKEACAELDISRAHWYRLLHAFMDRVLAGAKAIESHNLSAAAALPHRADAAGVLRTTVKLTEESDEACELADAPYRAGARGISDGGR